MQIDLDQITIDFAAGRYGPATVRQLLQYTRWQQEEIRRLEAERDRLASVVDAHFGRRLEAEAEVERLRRELADAQETVDTLAGRNFALEALHGLEEERKTGGAGEWD